MKESQKRKISLRTCVGCKNTKPKRELTRIVRRQSGKVSIDVSGKVSGRGAYVCPDENCFLEATKRQALARALNVGIDEKKLRELEANFLHSIEKTEDRK